MASKYPIDISFQEHGLSEIRSKLADMEKRAPAVMANALNQTQTILKKHLSDQVGQIYSYKRKLQKPRPQRASTKNLTARLIYSRKDPGLDYFDFTPGSQGDPRNTRGSRLAARVRSAGGFKDITNAFMMKSGSTDLIMQRDGSKRLPMSRLFGPSEHNMVNHVWREDDTQRYTNRVLAEKVNNQINIQFLKKWGMPTKEAKNYIAGK